MKNLTDSELAHLESATTESEWNNICSAIKKNHGGQYPEDWFQRVILSGILTMAEDRFKQAATVDAS